MKRMLRLSCCWLLTLAAFSSLWSSSVATGVAAETVGDWPHWRGPFQNGMSLERNLPATWSPKSGENLLWRREEWATRSTPVVFGNRLYTVCRAFPETTKEGEKLVCINAENGDLMWESIHNVYLSDAPAERVGWSSPVVDPATGNVYYLGLGCYFQGLNGETGEPLWTHSMSEEFGMLSTYGGRTNFPIVFEDLVIISGVTTAWGDQAVPAHRFYAFHKKTGQLIWTLSTRLRPEDTTYSTPFVTMLNGQPALVLGAGDGSVYAVQPRTGKVIWKYDASNRGINTMPLVSDGIVYLGHSEQNASDTNVLGAVFAFNGNRTTDVAETDLLWKIPGRTVGRSQPVKIGDRLYTVDDGGTLWIVEAQTGKDVAKQKIGRIMFGSMVHGDGKIYVGEATGRFYIMEPTAEGVKVLSQERLNGEEILGSPIIAHGRIYLPTNAALYCIGLKDRQPAADPAPEVVKPAKADPNGTVAQLQLVPAEVLMTASGRQAFQVRGYDAEGRYLKTVQAEITAEGPGQIDAQGIFTAASGPEHTATTLTAKMGDLTSTARIRTVPGLDWKFDFNDKKVPVTWIGAAYRHQPKELNGEQVLVKISTIPKGTRSQSWMGPTHLHDYTVQADFLATKKNEKLPDMGVIAQRYALSMLATQELQIRSWTSRLELRFASSIPFQWQPDTWYRLKFRASNENGQAVLRGKVWPRDGQEPAEWMIEAADATPNTTGSPGLFGNASDAEFYIDNVQVTANQ